MIDCVNKGMGSLLDKYYKKDKTTIEKKIKEVWNIFSTWNFRYDLEEKAAAIFLAWEVNMASYFQEFKIDNEDVRKGISGNFLTENFLFLEIREWSSLSNPPKR